MHIPLPEMIAKDGVRIRELGALLEVAMNKIKGRSLLVVKMKNTNNLRNKYFNTGQYIKNDLCLKM